jgi:hypothetical protein
MRMIVVKPNKLLRYLPFLVVNVAILGACDCTSSSAPKPVVTIPALVTDQANCPGACAHLVALGCAEGNPISMGKACQTDDDCVGLDGKTPDLLQACVSAQCTVSCTNFCIATENEGVYLDPTCVMSITACSQVNTCPALSTTGTTCSGSACKVSPTSK